MDDCPDPSMERRMEDPPVMFSVVLWMYDALVPAAGQGRESLANEGS
jgi:hypothetical protein